MTVTGGCERVRIRIPVVTVTGGCGGVGLFVYPDNVEVRGSNP